MINSVNHSHAPTLAESLIAAIGTPSGIPDISFDQQLVSVIEGSLSDAGLNPGQYKVVSVEDSQNSAGPNTPRQITVTYLPNAPLGEMQPTVDNPAGDAVLGDAVEVLKDALQSAGIDTSRFDLKQVNERCFYPGGYYIDRNVDADFGGGLKEKYSVGLVLRNPEVAVVEIRRLLEMAGKVEGAGASPAPSTEVTARS